MVRAPGIGMTACFCWGVGACKGKGPLFGEGRVCPGLHCRVELKAVVVQNTCAANGHCVGFVFG